MLRRDIETRLTNETKANVLEEEMQTIYGHLGGDEEESLRFRVAPLTRVSQTPVAPSSILDTDLGINPRTGESPIEEISGSHTLWRESALTRSIIKNSTTFSLRSVRKSRGSFHSAGLFDDCRHAFFNNDSEISVYQLGDLRTKTNSPSFSKILTQQYKHGELIRNVASSQGFIIIVTNKRIIIFKVDVEAPIDTISHGEWDPSGLACHESETHLVVFLGQCQRNKSNKYNGQIRVYRYRRDGQVKKLPVFALNVPANDCPKRLCFDTDSQILTCITRVQNKLLVWKLNGDFLSPSEPFEYLKNKYTAVSARSTTTPADRC